MPKPSSKLDWIPSDDPLKISEPSTALKNAGYAANQKPTFQDFNWFLNITDKWIDYFETETDQLVSGTANQILGMNAAGTDTQYKTIAATGPITVTHATGLVTIAMPAAGSAQAGYVSDGVQSFSGNKTFLNDLAINGSLTVSGTLTYLSVENLQVEDANIQLNYGGTNATAAGSGFETLGTSNASLAKLAYDSALASRYKIGPTGSEKEIIAASPGTAGQFLRSAGGAASPVYETVLGFIPIGGIIATMSHLTGAYNCSATTAADAAGFVVCGGQTIADVTSPMNGQVVPNLNNNNFIMGNATAGSTGGANNITLTTANLPAHNHSINHDHAAFTSAAGSAHSHGAGSLANAPSSVTGTANSGVNLAHSHPITDPFHSHTIVTFGTAGGIVFGGGNPLPNNTSGGAMLSTTGSQTGITSTNNSGSLDHSHTLSGTAAAQIISGTTGSESAHTHSIDVPSFTGTSGIAGSDTAFENRPAYITAEYIMRIK